MSEIVTSQFNTANINNSQKNILDFLQFKDKLKSKDFTTLELVHGSILSLVGNNINLLNELTVVAAAQNFSLYLKRNKMNKKIFISHDGSLQGLIFSKVFASTLISEEMDAYFNHENKPLNNSMAVYAAKKSKINFGHIVTFSSHIQKNLHCISFFDKNGMLLSSSKSKEINALISETNFLNLEIPNKSVPTIEENDIEKNYLNELKSTTDLSQLNITVSNPFVNNFKIVNKFFEINNIKANFIEWKKMPTKENSVTRKSLISTFFSKKDIILNFNENINNFEVIVKYKKRWKFLTLNDLSLLYVYYKREVDFETTMNKEIYCSYLANKYISYYAKKCNIKTEEYISLTHSLDDKNKSKVLLATNGENYFVPEENNTFCSDPLINIKIFLEMYSYFKSKQKNLYGILTSIYLDNGIFYFDSKKEKLDIESANIFFNRIQNLKEINGYKIIKINRHPFSSMNIEIILQDKIVINLEYSKNINQLISNISIWNVSDNKQKNNEDIFMDLIVKQKNIANELNSLKETFNVTKFSWQGILKYSLFVLIFVCLFYLMFTFVLGGDRTLWNNVLTFLRKQKDFSYLIPVIILTPFIFVFLSCYADKILLKKLNEKVKIRHLWVANTISICISSITPLIYGGESVGYWYLRRKGLNRSSVAAIFLIKSLFTQLNFIVFSAIFTPIGFIRFYDAILNNSQGQGVFMIVLIIIGMIFDIFSAVMISLLTFSSRLTSSLAKIINKIIEWTPFVVSRHASKRGAQLKYEFTNINSATKRIFYNDIWYKNLLVFLEIFLLYLFLKFIDLGYICAWIGNFLNGTLFESYINMLAGQTMIRSINALNFITPSGLGVSDWATKNILAPLFRSQEGYSVDIYQTMNRILLTISIVVLSAFMLLTVFIGESRIDKYNKIKKTLTQEEIVQGNIRIKTRFYSFAFIPWTLGIIGLVMTWYLIYQFVIL
ncbi:MAG: hypothetical protein HDR43_01945 [Mycoplasma sp.]|nr:hypothetical protein [Mycoplasma sp.]